MKNNPIRNGQTDESFIFILFLKAMSVLYYRIEMLEENSRLTSSLAGNFLVVIISMREPGTVGFSGDLVSLGMEESVLTANRSLEAVVLAVRCLNKGRISAVLNTNIPAVTKVARLAPDYAQAPYRESVGRTEQTHDVSAWADLAPL